MTFESGLKQTDWNSQQLRCSSASLAIVPLVPGKEHGCHVQALGVEIPQAASALRAFNVTQSHTKSHRGASSGTEATGHFNSAAGLCDVTQAKMN